MSQVILQNTIELQIGGGQFSVSLYLCHSYYAHYMGSILNIDNPVYKIIIYIVVSSFTAMIVCVISQMIKRNRCKHRWVYSKKLIEKFNKD